VERDGPEDHVVFEVLQTRTGRSLRARASNGKPLAGFDTRARGEQQGPLDQVLQLPYVTGVVISGEEAERLAAEPVDRGLIRGPCFRKKCDARRGVSSDRSRRLGTTMEMTFNR
jgi:hypothetical protein